MTEERNYEEEARKQGWRPKEEFSGPEGKWTDAQTFVEKGEQILPILKARADRQDVEIQSLKRANKEFGDYTQQMLQKERTKSVGLLQDLEVARAKAVTEGDGQEFTRLDREMTQVRHSMEAAPQQQTIDPNGQAWLAENSWYETNPKLRRYADGLADELIAQGFNGQAYYKELTSRVQEDFAEEFRNPNQGGANSVEDVGTRTTPSDSTKPSYDNLPDDAKAACDRFVANGLTSQEDYVKNYEWE